MQSIQHLFSNSEYEIVIPKKEILKEQRDQVFYDQTIQYYIIQTLPKHSFSSQQLLDYIQQSIEIHIVSTFGEEDSLDTPTVFISQSRGSSRVEKFASLGIEFPLIPVVGKEDKVLFSEYGVGDSLQPIISDKHIFYPFSSQIDIGRKRATNTQKTRMTLTAFVTELPSETIPENDHFNCMAPLKDDSLFDKVPVLLNTPSKVPFKKLAQKVIQMGPLVKCLIHVFALSNSHSIIGLEMDAKETVTIQDIVIDMPHTVLKRDTELPIRITPSESCTILYNCRLLDSSEPDQRKSLSFSVQLQRDGVEMNTWFCARLPIQDGSLLARQQPANHGRLFESIKTDPKPFYGLEVSVSLLPPVLLQIVFSVKVLVSNTGTRVRNLQVEIPNLQKEQKTITRSSLSSNQDIVKEYKEQRTSSIICLENSVAVVVPPQACRLFMLHYIVIQGQVHDLPPIHFVDKDTQERFTISECLTIHVQ